MTLSLRNPTPRGPQIRVEPSQNRLVPLVCFRVHRPPPGRRAAFERCRPRSSPIATGERSLPANQAVRRWLGSPRSALTEPRCIEEVGHQIGRRLPATLIAAHRCMERRAAAVSAWQSSRMGIRCSWLPSGSISRGISLRERRARRRPSAHQPRGRGPPPRSTPAVGGFPAPAPALAASVIESTTQPSEERRSRSGIVGKRLACGCTQEPPLVGGRSSKAPPAGFKRLRKRSHRIFPVLRTGRNAAHGQKPLNLVVAIHLLAFVWFRTAAGTRWRRQAKALLGRPYSDAL